MVNTVMDNYKLINVFKKGTLGDLYNRLSATWVWVIAHEMVASYLVHLCSYLMLCHI